MADPADFQAKLRAMSDDYAAKLPEKLGQIERAWEQLPEDRWDDDGFEMLHRMVHSLTGSGKTFGFALLSDVARNFEGYLKQIMQVRAAPDEDQRKHIRIFMSELRQVVIQTKVPNQAELIVAAPRANYRFGTSKV